MSANDLPRWATLPEPNFIDRDPQVITAEIVALYEQRTGKTLYPAQAERILVDVIAYRETLVRIGIQDAAKQCLVRFARAPMLDYLAEMVGVTRLPARPAVTTLRFTLESPRTSALLIAAGTRVESSDGHAAFSLDADLLLPAGQTWGDGIATCIDPGEDGNGWQPGQIATLIDDMGDPDVSITNITVSQGGAAEEIDDRLRERIFLAPEAFSTAGSRLAYRFHAMSAHQSIVDVAVLGPSLVLQNGQLVSLNGIPPGCVRLYPLLKTGLPDETILLLVEEACSAEKVRPLCDEVQALSPTDRTYAIEAALTVYQTADKPMVLALAQAAAEAFAADRAAALGRDVVPSQISAALSVSGVYDVELSGLAERLVVNEHEWAHCTQISIRLAGVVNG